MRYLDKLEEGYFYHIYNRSNGVEDLFREDTDYEHFLELYDKYICPVADTYAWALMPNHFHYLIRIKERMYYRYSKNDFSKTNANRSLNLDAVRFEDVKWKTVKLDAVHLSAFEKPDRVNNRKKANPTHHFSHLFSSYAKYINGKYKRSGSLYQRPFKRNRIDNIQYLRNALVYIHYNPVHHGFTNEIDDYPWTSFHNYLPNEMPEYIVKHVFEWFGGRNSFFQSHSISSPIDKLWEKFEG
ncbi:hypothetical protein [Membranihabitans maritimus]|uniref:hypothetical protein n=1 Tax=Membranihabitans maritimus TaxID=2904244 RepID=UPI001F48EDD4|nr:hypothetical protein [Membranihabitans maritimus]